MSQLAPGKRSGSPSVGVLLRQWRQNRGRTQLELALDAGLSQRHISFVESGRTAPSRETIMEMSIALDVPLRDRNALLLAAGYAPLYAEDPWDAPQMEAINKALKRMLRQHEPYPAIVMDRHWNVVTTNAAAPRFFGRFIDIAARPRPRNMLELIFDPDGMRPFVHDWPHVAKGLIGRVHREAAGRVMDAPLRGLLKKLKAYADVSPDWAYQAAAEGTRDSPVISLSFVHQGAILNYFSMVTTVGAPSSITAQELRLESMFPADEATERGHEELMGDAPDAGRPVSR